MSPHCEGPRFSCYATPQARQPRRHPPALPLTVRHADASAIASTPPPIAARPSPDGLHRALAAAAPPRNARALAAKEEKPSSARNWLTSSFNSRFRPPSGQRYRSGMPLSKQQLSSARAAKATRPAGSGAAAAAAAAAGEGHERGRVPRARRRRAASIERERLAHLPLARLPRLRPRPNHISDPCARAIACSGCSTTDGGLQAVARDAGLADVPLHARRPRCALPAAASARALVSPLSLSLRARAASEVLARARHVRGPRTRARRVRSPRYRHRHR